jgi:methionyl-tRNA synthetase
LVNGKCPDHPNGEIEKVEEENYFFKLSRYKDQVANLIKNDEYKIVPEMRKHEMLTFLENARDVSFSRPKTSLPWGVPVPGDEEHVMYVWCDALSNYITGQGYGINDNWENTWPADLHIV